MIRLLTILFIIVSLTNCQHRTPHRLKLVQVYEVETNGQLEPSGLTLWGDTFYTVSDKQDFIYQLIFNGNKISLKPIISIENNRDTKLDFEGITHDDENFYLVSEKYFQILKVSKDGSQQTWINTSNLLKQAGLQAGLFQTKNANFEGICLIGNNHFLLAAERQPRGFIEFNSKSNKIHAYQMNQAVFPYNKDRSPDFTGLSCDNGLYVLDRNAETIAKLKYRKGKYHESKGYSFHPIVNQPNLIYQDTKYGQAEGLVVKDGYFYIILDNNRSYHQQDKNNNNSLFIKLRKP